jgi:hypothetical protein
MSTPRKMPAGVPKGSVLSLTLYSMYITDAPETPGAHLTLFTDREIKREREVRNGK